MMNNASPVRSWYSVPADALARDLRSNLEAGLSADEVSRRQIRDGFNELPEAQPPSLLRLFLSQFTSVIVWVLIGAAAISGLLQDWLDGAAILAVVFLNGLIGFVQEYRAEQSLAALRKLSVAIARVLRDGLLRSIPARDLVAGDLVVLEAGDRIPADARLLYVTNFQAQEAALTGESTSIQKDVRVLEGADVPLADRINMVFMGTVAVSGKARALVVATGRRTELGHIAAMMQTAGEAERTETPLQRRLEQFSYTLLWLALAVVSVVFVLGFLRGEPLMEMFLTAVSLAVAAVPEGLPAVVTITLALGVTRMAKRHALIRKLPAVETLGSASVICTDKTGTLTKNEMTVTKIFVGDTTYEVTGEGYEPIGTIGGGLQHGALPEGLCRLLCAAVLCNGATLRKEDGVWRILGDPTEGALLVAAAKGGFTLEELQPNHRFLGEIPFNPERKRMTIVRHTSKGPAAFVKGAPDVLLSRCLSLVRSDGAVEKMTEPIRNRILHMNAVFAKQALRVLGIADRHFDAVPDVARADELESELVFLGLVAMKDPLRPEAKAAIQLCHEAGIQTVMITGDHKDTAVAIASEMGISVDEGNALSGSDMNNLIDEQLVQRVERVAVYARVSAEHKLRIVQAWKTRGAVVAMTGDGVNDAPAIKAADIGVAMGVNGTDVTKEAADMVVTDDNFASIAAAVEEGRGVFDNIRKAVHFLLSCNVGEVLVMLLATLLNLPLPLLPIQILWMNLITDSIPALALAVDPKAPDLMKRPPRRPDERLLDRRRLWAIAGEGLWLALLALGAFCYNLFVWHRDIEEARTVAFTVMVFTQLVHAFNCRNERLSLFQLGVWTNRFLVWAFLLSLAIQIAVITIPAAQLIFKTASLPVEDWVMMAAAGVLTFAVMEAIKLTRQRIERHAR